MRAIRRTVKGLAPLVVFVAVMAAPAVAVEYPGEWAEYDEAPIGTVTADISGNVDIEIVGASISPITATCQVTGEIELSNDGTGGNPAIQKVVSLHPVDIDGSGPWVCDGNWLGCPTTQVTYNTPWTGTTTAYYESTFDDFSMSTTWCGSGGFTAASIGPLSMTPIDVQLGSESCIGGFEADEALAYDPFQTLYQTEVTATLELDLDSLEGLSTEEGGPCVKLIDA